MDETPQAMIDIIKSDKSLERRVEFTQRALVVLIALFLAIPVGTGWWLSRQYPSINAIRIDNLQLLSDAVLCPGDDLVWSYDFHATGAGTLVRDRTLWYVDPPRTKVYSLPERFILEGPIDQHLIETWSIPLTYRNPETNQVEPLPPGRYRRLLSISSPSRSSVISIQGVDFEIREGCKL